MDNIFELINGRRSVRTFDGKDIDPTLTDKLLSFAQKAENPFGLGIRYRLLNAVDNKLSCPVVVGTRLFLAAAMEKQPRAEEAFGYSFESVLLYARSLGLDGLWVGGTMDRAGFEKAMALEDGEFMPCVSPIGCKADKMSVRETLMRKGVKADSRMEFEELFFCGGFDSPMSRDRAGELTPVLEAVRLSPSAVNKQPWRLLIMDGNVHFYLKRTKGFGTGALDMQKIDIGIALCHFELAAKAVGIKAEFIPADNAPEADGLEYIASYRIV